MNPPKSHPKPHLTALPTPISVERPESIRAPVGIEARFVEFRDEIQLWCAEERSARQRLEGKVDNLIGLFKPIAKNAGRLMNNPKMQALLGALVAFAIAWLSRHT